MPPSVAYTPNKDYTIDVTDAGRLGAGGHGIVCLGRSVETGDPVAVKITRVFPDMSLKEAALLQHLDHSNVIKVHSLQRNSTGSVLFMVMEVRRCACGCIGDWLSCALAQLCTGGELFDIVAEHGALSPRCALRYFQSIVAGLAYCHKQVQHAQLVPCDPMTMEGLCGRAWHTET